MKIISCDAVIVTITIIFLSAGIREGEHIEKLDPQQQKKARLLVNLEKDVLLQWIGLIFMTLDELHVNKVQIFHNAV